MSAFFTGMLPALVFLPMEMHTTQSQPQQAGTRVVYAWWGRDFLFYEKGNTKENVIPSSAPPINPAASCVSLEGTWYLARIDDLEQAPSFAYVLHQHGCEVMGNSAINVVGNSHLVHLSVVGNKATGTVQRSINACTTLFLYTADVDAPANRMLVDASGSDCENIIHQHLTFERR